MAARFGTPIIVGLIAVIIIAALLISYQSNIFAGIKSGSQATAPQQTATETTTTGTVKEFTVHGSNFKFSPNSITVNKGDKVKIIFISDDSSHDICVEGYGCSSVVRGGQTITLEFMANESGNIKFFCSVDGHRSFGMEGNFIIQ